MKSVIQGRVSRLLHAQPERPQEIGKRLEEQRRNTLYNRVTEHCTSMAGGLPVRGFVTKIDCPWCGTKRWDDGTPCEKCKRFVSHGEEEDGGTQS